MSESNVDIYVHENQGSPKYWAIDRSGFAYWGGLALGRKSYQSRHTSLTPQQKLREGYCLLVREAPVEVPYLLAGKADWFQVRDFSAARLDDILSSLKSASMRSPASLIDVSAAIESARALVFQARKAKPDPPEDRGSETIKPPIDVWFQARSEATPQPWSW